MQLTLKVSILLASLCVSMPHQTRPCKNGCEFLLPGLLCTEILEDKKLVSVFNEVGRQVVLLNRLQNNKKEATAFRHAVKLSEKACALALEVKNFPTRKSPRLPCACTKSSILDDINRHCLTLSIMATWFIQAIPNNPHLFPQKDRALRWITDEFEELKRKFISPCPLDQQTPTAQEKNEKKEKKEKKE